MYSSCPTVPLLAIYAQLAPSHAHPWQHTQAPTYYRGTNAALLLYDITNQVSFRDIRGWLEGEPSFCYAFFAFIRTPVLVPK
jgi:Ras family